MNALIPAPQHLVPSPCPVAADLDQVQRWRSQLLRIQEEIDQSITGRMDTYCLEDAANGLEAPIAALRKEMNRIQDGE